MRRLLRQQWWWVAAIAVGMAALVAILPRDTRGQSSRPPAARAVPVVAAHAHRGNVPVYLTGLGTVTPLNTVTVRSRVDGELVRVDFHEGQLVRRGDLLAEIDPRPFQVQLTQAEGQQAKDAATLQNARLDLQRYQDLFTKGLIPKQQLDTQAATLNQSEGAVKSDLGQIDSARLNLAYTRIAAPIAGRVGLRLVDPGNIIHAADTNGLVVITQLDPIGIVFTIPEDNLAQVVPRMRGSTRLTVDAFDRDLKTKIASGTLLTIDNQIDQTTGTVKLKAEFPNGGNQLFPNQFVNARVLVDTVRNAVIVPAAAIQRSPKSTFVYVVKPDHTVAMRDVVVRMTQGDDAALTSGVSENEEIVTDGVDKLQDGTLVAVQGGGRGATTAS